MNTLKINIPEGFKIKAFDEQSGEVSFEPIPKSAIERIKGWTDILAHHNMRKADFDKWCENCRPHEKGSRKEEMIVAAYNGKQLTDPLPDWRDGKAKVYPIFNMPAPSGAGFSYLGFVSWRTDSGVGSRLVFTGPNAVANMKDATTKFIHEYQESRTL